MDLLEKYYNKFNEDKRLLSRHGQVEFFIADGKYIPQIYIELSEAMEYLRYFIYRNKWKKFKVTSLFRQKWFSKYWDTIRYERLRFVKCKFPATSKLQMGVN